MAAIIIGSVTGGELMPCATLSYNTDGTISGTAKYAYAQTDTPSVIGNTHTDDSRAYCIAYDLEFDEVFQYATLRYQGVWSASAIRVDVQAGLQANPIETHPNFVSTLGGTPASPLNDAIFDTTGVFLGWPAGAPDNLGGVRVYLAVANTYRFTQCTSSAVTLAAALGDLGTIASSISAGGMTVSGTDAFMCQAVTIDFAYVGISTQIYTYSIVWVSTQPPGWNTNIYPP